MSVYPKNEKGSADTRGTSSRSNDSAKVTEKVYEFVDLGLPSRTRWANDFLRNAKGQVMLLTYDEAEPFQLPTPEQLKELVGSKRIVFDQYVQDLPEGVVYTIVGPHGDLQLPSTPFWLNSVEISTTANIKTPEQLAQRKAAAALKVKKFDKENRFPVILVDREWEDPNCK